MGSTVAPQPARVGAGTATRTFLFTDIEGSTRLLQELGRDYARILDEHLALLRAAIAQHGGHEFGTAGDAIFAAFDSAVAGIAAAVAGQRALAGHPWKHGRPVKVRMGLHTGEAEERHRDFVGLDVHVAARVCSAAWGGQILASQTTRDLVGQRLPDGCELRDLGEHRLKDLARPAHLYQVVIAGLDNDFPPPRSLDAVPNNLPTQLTSFVGRERELADARDLLKRTRLLTLTGPGGTGKTRLSLQLAAEVADEYTHGVFFVPLAPISDPDLVPSAILEALRLQDAAGRSPLRRLTDHLADKDLLLVLDNFEQVLAAAPTVAELLHGSAHLRIVVTSRSPLHVYGEQELPVPALGLPTGAEPAELAESEAVALFVDRATAVHPGFTLADGHAAAVAQITARLDGLPLAIELAAARVKLLSPEAIAARLDQALGLLSSGSRDLPERQQTLRAAIAWSYDLLDEPVRHMLARLSAFVGGATLDDIEVVCGTAHLGTDVLDAIAVLVDHSLLRRSEATELPRFWMLQTIREFALEQLEASGEADEVRDRHARRFLALVEEAAPHLTRYDQAAWLDRLELELHNLGAALDHLVASGQTPLALRFVADVWRLWQIRGHLHEARMRADQVLAQADAGSFPDEHAAALTASGSIEYWHGDFVRALERYERAVEIRRSQDDERALAEALYNVAFPLSFGEFQDSPRALDVLHEAEALFRGLDDTHGLARVLWASTSVLYFSGRREEAKDTAFEALALWRQLDDAFGLGWALHIVGLVSLRFGEAEAAREHWREALTLFARARDISAVVLLLEDFRQLAASEGDWERAHRLEGAKSRLREDSGTDLVFVIQRMEEEIGLPEDPLAPEERAAREAEGRAMSVDEAVAYALQG